MLFLLISTAGCAQLESAPCSPDPPTHPPTLPYNLQVPKRKGQDPATDVREKGLQRLATKGVVRLFNAIAKAQKQLRDAEEATGSRAKAVKLGKASFLAQLKGSAAGAGGAAAAGGKAEQPLVPLGPRQAIPGVAAAAAAPAEAAAVGAVGKKQQQRQRKAAAAAESSDDEDASGWEVLQQGFVGLQGALSSLLARLWGDGAVGTTRRFADARFLSLTRGCSFPRGHLQLPPPALPPLLVAQAAAR